MVEYFRGKKAQRRYPMSAIYALAGRSRQGHQQQCRTQIQTALERRWVCDQVLALRLKHPVMGLRKCYMQLLRCSQAAGTTLPVGRDIFIQYATSAGLCVVLPRNYTRTTFSTKSHRYYNLLVDYVLTDINQLWVSDITYVRLSDRYYYLTMVMDVYSRRILGYKLAASLHADSCLDALKMALKQRPITDYQHRLVHHSDKGTQYVFNPYTALLEQYNINISMCNSPYENSHMERLNGTIKNEYIIPLQFDTFDALNPALPSLMNRYNTQRLHQELGYQTPQQWEINLLNIPLLQRPKLPIFVEQRTKIFQQQYPLQLSFFS